MQRKGNLRHWMLPSNELNKSTVFHSRPPGNSPEVIPLCDDMFEDWMDGLKARILYAMSLSEDHPSKFSRSIPERLSSSLRRL